MKAGVKAEQVRATERQSKQEVTKLFNNATPAKHKMKIKASTVWKHKFSCLAYRGQIRIPTTDVEKDDLLQAGLGEKEISFHDMNASAEEFRDIICGEFPQLKKAGGFQRCKCRWKYCLFLLTVPWKLETESRQCEDLHSSPSERYGP